MKSQELLSKQQVEVLLNKSDVFLLDCDGVIWLGDQLLPNAEKTIELIRSREKKTYFVTNNSSKSRVGYQKKFEQFGIHVNIEEIFNSAYISALYIKNQLNLKKGEKVFVLGEQGLQDELESAGLECIGSNNQNYQQQIDVSQFSKDDLDPNVKVVLCGIDFHISYYKYALALNYLLENDCHFLATGLDSTLPSSKALLPGTGSLISVLSTASKRETICLGKPSVELMNIIDQHVQLDRSKCCFIGDRMDTDICFANRVGLGCSLLVINGSYTKNDVESNGVIDAYKPTFYITHLGKIYDIVENFMLLQKKRES